MSIASLNQPGSLPQSLNALFGQLSPLKTTGTAASNADNDFDDSSAHPAGAGSPANTALTGGGKSAISDQTLGFFNKLQEQPGPTNPGSSAPESASQFLNGIRAFENANSVTNAATATAGLSMPLNTLWQSAMSAGATLSLTA